jgi:hypothetical protein
MPHYDGGVFFGPVDIFRCIQVTCHIDIYPIFKCNSLDGYILAQSESFAAFYRAFTLLLAKVRTPADNHLHSRHKTYLCHHKKSPCFLMEYIANVGNGGFLYGSKYFAVKLNLSLWGICRSVF